MEHQTLGDTRTPRGLIVLTVGGFAGAVALAAILTTFGVNQNVDSVTMPVTGRTLNQFMAVVLTCIALIVPLTANLYTPKLVTLYVRHPLIVTMLSLLLLSQIICLCLNFIPTARTLNHVLVSILALIYLVVIMGALPFLYSISRFLRPSYFMPMLTRKGINSLRAVERRRNAMARGRDFFETIDVVTNIALTGMNRGDRQLVLLSLRSLHTFLAEIIGSGWGETKTWRTTHPQFSPGLAQEGQDYLMRERIWPEAYVLAQMLKIMETATKRQHEILAELASQLVETAHLASAFQRDKVAELHIMTFNTLMSGVIEEKDLRRFQNLSYYYRLLIEAFLDQPGRMHETTQHLLHYAKVANKLGLYFAMETVIYDMAEVVLSIARHSEEPAIELVQAWAGPLWQDSIDGGTHMRKIAWRAILRVYWEAKALELETLAETIYWRYLSDETIHREQVEMALDENRELHFEFNDRLMRFAHLSPHAEALAQEFVESAER